MSKGKKIHLHKVLYYDKTYYAVDCDPIEREEYYSFCREIGDEAYVIDKVLYIDESAYFNICMKDSTSIFIIL